MAMAEDPLNNSTPDDDNRAAQAPDNVDIDIDMAADVPLTDLQKLDSAFKMVRFILQMRAGQHSDLLPAIDYIMSYLLPKFYSHAKARLNGVPSPDDLTNVAIDIARDTLSHFLF